MSDLTSKTGQVPDQLGNTIRANDTVFEGKQLTITLVKINDIILDYFQNVINPTIEDNNEARTVPIVYGDGERWEQVRQHGYLRDGQSDKLLTPIIMIRRTNIKQGKLNNPNNKYLHTSSHYNWNSRNVYDKFAVLNGVNPSRKIVNTIVPDYLDLEYEVIMWTEYQAQMDQLIEQINVENYEFWGNRNNFKFRVNIDQFQNKTELPSVGDRAVRVQFNININAYLLPERVVKNFKLASTSTTDYTVKKVVMKEKIITPTNPNGESTD